MTDALTVVAGFRRDRWKSLVLAAFGAVLAFTSPAAAVAPQNFVLREKPQPVPEIRFADAEGRVRMLADFRGKVVLLNVWATWCVTCREEMPTLDRLQAALGGPDFEVVALSIDRAGPEAVRRFYTEIGIQHLSLRIDASAQAMSTLGVVGLPTTLLIDRQGRELGRLIGPAEWDTPEMIAFLKSAVAEPAGPK